MRLQGLALVDVAQAWHSQPMNSTPMHVAEYMKATVSLCSAAVCYFADLAGQDISQLPALISDLGLPVAFLISVCYALVSTNKALRASEAGRLSDRDEFMKQIRADSERSEISRIALKEAFQRQADAVDRLADEIRRRP